MDSTLRPRDIQARIRAGESAEQVAAAAGAGVEAIMPYAAPVLAERAHLAQTALRASVRRTSGPSGGARTLGHCVELFLSEQRLQDHDLAWDSWRRPDGKWALVAQWQQDGRELTAELVHDLQGRYVVAQNDEARLLTGEAAGSSAPDPGARRLSAVAEGESPLGDDAIELVREDDPDQVTELDWSAPTGVMDEPEPAPEPEPEPDEETVEVPVGEDPAAEPDTEPDTEPEAEPGTDADPGDEADGADQDQPALDLGPEAEQPKPKRKGRASVPSWDEIMFGGGPKD